jgi:phosphotransacetylase
MKTINLTTKEAEAVAEILEGAAAAARMIGDEENAALLSRVFNKVSIGESNMKN